MPGRKTFIAMIFVLVLVSAAGADQVRLKNGDTVSGTIVGITGGKVVFNTQQLGAVTVDANNVAALSDDKIVLKNSDSLTGKIGAITGGQLVLQSDMLGELTIDMEKVAGFQTAAAVARQPVVAAPVDPNAAQEVAEAAVEAEAEAKPKAGEEAESEEEAKPDKTNWNGNISAGISSSHGNTVKDSYSLSANMVRRSVDDRWTLGADYAKSRQKDPTTGKKVTTEDWWRANAKYDYFLSKKWYLYGDGRYEKDAISKLDRRIVVGGGGGYQWVESDDFNFRTEAGIASVYERFDDQTDSSSKISAQLGYHLDKKIYENISFINDLTYYPSFERPSDYFLTTTAEIRATLLKQLFANFKIIFDYDTSPAATAQSTDIKYFFGLGYEF